MYREVLEVLTIKPMKLYAIVVGDCIVILILRALACSWIEYFHPQGAKAYEYYSSKPQSPTRWKSIAAVVPQPQQTPYLVGASQLFSLGHYCCTSCTVSLTFHDCSCLEIPQVM